MAFVTKYTISKYNHQTSTTWNAHIQEDGATFDSNLAPGPSPISINYTCDSSEPDWVVAPSVATISFVDDSSGKLVEFFNSGTDQRYKLLIQEGSTTVWSGFIDPESYRTVPYKENYVSTFQATDRLSVLRNSSFKDGALFYEGQERFSTILAQCLDKTGLDLDMATHSQRYSYLASNSLDEEDDPLYYHTVDQSVFLDSQGNAYSCWTVLINVLAAWGLQLFQAQGKWCIYERERNVSAILPYTFNSWNYTSAGAQDTPVLSTVNAKIEVSDDSADELFFHEGLRGGAEVAIGQADFTYCQGDIDQIFSNLDFDTDDNLSDNWTIVGVPALDNDAHEGDNSVDLGADWQLSPNSDGALHYIHQSAITSVSSATGYKFRIKLRLKMPERLDLPSGREAYWYFKFKVGSNFFKWSDTTWTGTDTLNEIPIYNYIQTADWSFDFTFTTPVLDGLSGTPYMEFRNVVEDDPGSGSQTQFSILLDTITFDLINPSSQVVKRYSKTSATISGTTNGEIKNIGVSYFGEGPLDLYPGAIHQKDSTDSDVGIATDWKLTVPSSATGHSFDRLTAERKIVQFGSPARYYDGPIAHKGTAASTEVRPENQIQIERPDSTTIDECMWYRSLTWKPADPQNNIKASWCAINDDSFTTVITVNALDEIDEEGNAISIANSVVSVVSNTQLETVESETALQALSVGDTSQAVIMQSYNSGQREGAGTFVKDSTDTSSTTNDITIFASTDGKRIHRVGSEYPWAVQWAGAKGDGTTDDATALSDIIAAAAGGAITLPPGRYVVDSTITIDGQALSMIGQQSSYYKDDGRTGFNATPSGAVIMSGSSLTGPIFKIQDTTTTNEEFSPIHFENIHFIGNGTTDTHAIQVIGGSNVQVKNCNITGFTSDGFKSETSTVGNTNQPVTIKLLGSTFEGNGGNGASLDCQSSIIDDCIFVDNTSGGLLAVETSVANTFSRNTFSSNDGYGLKVAGLGGSVISENLSSGNDGAGIFVGHSTLLAVQTVVNNTVSSNGVDTGNTNENRAGITLKNIFAGTITGNTTSFNGSYGMFFDVVKNTALSGNTGTGNTLGFLNTRAQKVSGVYNAIEYGALQAGNNESGTLAELISAAEEGSVIELPHGDYMLESSVAINKAVTIRGQATKESTGTIGTRIVAAASLDNPCFVISASGVKIERVNFIGDSLQAGNAHGVEWSSGSDGELRHCVITGFIGTGLRINSGVTDITAYDVRVDSCSDKGMFIQGDDCIIDRCKVTNNGTIGILTTNADDLIVSRSFISSNGTDGVQMQGGFHNIVTDCHIKLNDQNGINIRSGDNHSVQGCHINCNGADTGAATVERAGVYVREGNKHQVNNNHIGDNQASATQLHAVATGDLLNSAHIIGNTGEGNATAFFNLDSTSAGDLDIDLDHTETIDLASLNASTSTTEAITIAGARPGDRVTLGPPSNWDMDVQFWGYVSANDTLTIKFYNISGGAINQASGDWKIGLSRREGATASVPPATGLTALTIVNFSNANLLTQAD